MDKLFREVEYNPDITEEYSVVIFTDKDDGNPKGKCYVINPEELGEEDQEEGDVE